MRAKSERRAALAAKKKKALKLYPHDGFAKMANNLTPCSCHVCGNPRKHYPHQKTMQELRAIDRQNEMQD